MVFWTLAAVMLAAAALFALWPLRGGDSGARIDPRRAVLLERLREIEAERAPDDEAERAQIARQLLSLGDGRSRTPDGKASVVVASFVALFAIPAVVLPLYLSLGSPADALTVRSAVPLENQPLDKMVATAERHLAANPDDIDGWTVLARVYGTQGRTNDRLKALENLVRLQPSKTSWKTDLAQALSSKAGNIIPDRAVALLDSALQATPGDEKANFFRAVAYEQAGERDAALAIWKELAETRLDDPRWQDQMEQRITALSKPPSSIPEQTREALANAPADVRDDMIRGMVEGLADRLIEQPDDLQGWRRLLQAYTVLGTPEIALAALDSAISKQASDTDLRSRLAALRASAKEVK